MRTTRFRYAKNRKTGRPTNFKVLGAIKPKVPKQDLLIYLFQLIRFKDNWKCWMQQSLYTLNEYWCLYYLLVTDCFTCVAFFIIFSLAFFCFVLLLVCFVFVFFTIQIVILYNIPNNYYILRNTSLFKQANVTFHFNEPVSPSFRQYNSSEKTIWINKIK